MRAHTRTMLRIRLVVSVLVVALSALMALGACSPYPGATITEVQGGDLLVAVKGQQSFNALARFVYGDAELGRALAEAAGMSYQGGVPRGSVLTIPSKQALTRYTNQENKTGKLYRQGMKALHSGDYEKAIKKFEGAALVRPDRTEIDLQLGIAHLRAGNLDAAEPLLRESARARATDPNAHYALGLLLRERNNVAAAFTEFKTALAVLDQTESHPKASFEHARALEDLGRPDEALDAYKLFLFEFPSDPHMRQVELRVEALETRAD